jgi:23S rRNA-/tRNA-specific pseudouridylate synthase
MPDVARASGVEIVHRDASLLVLYKPPGLPTTSPRPNELTLVQVAEALDPSAERLHPSSRLDAEVSGLVTFARTEGATRYLLDARERGLYRRAYVALAARAPEPAVGELHLPIGIDPRDARKRRVVGEREKGARASSTRYALLASSERAALIWLEPLTGRTHQLRVHMAHVGCPLLGDRPYGGAPRVVAGDGSVLGARRVMLHCLALRLPAFGKEPERAFTLLPPQDFAQLATAAIDQPLEDVLAERLRAL